MSRELYVAAPPLGVCRVPVEQALVAATRPSAFGASALHDERVLDILACLRRGGGHHHGPCLTLAAALRCAALTRSVRRRARQCHHLMARQGRGLPPRSLIARALVGLRRRRRRAAYDDKAVGTMAEDGRGTIWVSSVVLWPRTGATACRAARSCASSTWTRTTRASSRTPSRRK